MDAATGEKNYYRGKYFVLQIHLSLTLNYPLYDYYTYDFIISATFMKVMLKI